MSNNMSTVYIMRHGRTEWNLQGRLQGRLDSPLLPESVERLKAMGNFLRTRNIASVYSSPLKRCRISAGIVCGILNLSPVYLDDLVECDHGECEGKSLNEAMSQFPEFFEQRETGDKWNVKWPNGESYADIASRVKNAVQRMDFTSPALVLAHETTNKALAGLLLGLNKNDIMALRQRNEELFQVDLGAKRLDVISCN